MMKPKYPLTEAAKEAARYLVDAWNQGVVDQYFEAHDVTSGSGVRRRKFNSGIGASNEFDVPPIESLLELAQFRLIDVKPSYMGNDRQEILLMQELLNAVENDFAVSDYFLTVNAVGTIIQEGATVTAPFQSAALGYGNLTQNQVLENSELADKLLEMLGSQFLEANNQIVESIEEFRKSVESERQSKLGKVISQLGNSLQHGANAIVVTQALMLLAPHIAQIIS